MHGWSVTTLSATAGTAGVGINGPTTVNFTFDRNPEWRASRASHVGVILKLGRF